jgi:hypothetical protein
MATERTVNRNQKAEYVAGSLKKGFYTFSVQGVERKNIIHTAYFSFEGTGTTQDEAKKNAWQAAREWVAELGEVVKTDKEYRAEVE